MHNLYTLAWKLKSKAKLIAEIVGHMLKEIGRAAWFFSDRKGKISEKIFEEIHTPSPIAKARHQIIMLSTELRIVVARRNTLLALQGEYSE